jgi:hypothetical protein
MAGKLEAPYLVEINRIYVIRESDDAGTTFATGVANRLYEIGWKGDARCVVLPDAKDPNELHKRNPDAFKEAFQRALNNAERLSEAQPEQGKAEAAVLPVPYKESANTLFWLKPTQNGEMPVPLINFTARIVADIAEDDGAEIRQALEIEARLKGRVGNQGGSVSGPRRCLCCRTSARPRPEGHHRLDTDDAA